MAKYLYGLLFTCVLFADSPAHAQLPQRVSDLNPLGGNTVPLNLTSFNNKLYFSADDGNIGRELWSYDGSAGQPTLVADVAPGLRNGVHTFGGTIASPSFPILNGKMYMPGYLPSMPTLYTVLLSYDGNNPPVRAQGISDSVFFGLTDFITFGNRIFFAAGTPTTGLELYAYDGLSAPTVYDINPDTSSFPHAFTEFNGKLYFIANPDFANKGEELYVYDPATDQCSLVADVNPGPGNSYIREFAVAGNKLYFNAFTTNKGFDLHELDGTTVKQVTNLATSVGYGNWSPAVAYYQGSIIFGGSKDGRFVFPYRYDPNSGQAMCISDDSTSLGDLSSITEYKGKLYLTAGDGAGLPPTRGTELWKYDGTNLSMLTEIWPGRIGSRPANYHVHNGYLYFTAQDSTYGNELYRLYDPTSIVNTSFDGELKLFPNPAATQTTLELTLNSPQHISVSVADMTGKEVFTSGIRSFESGKSKFIIPLQSLACGSYSYQLMDGSGRRMAGGILIKE